MEPIKYYKDDRYDYDSYDECYAYYNTGNQDLFDLYQYGYNHLGYDTLTLINIVWNGKEMVHFFLKEDGEMLKFEGDDAEYITCCTAGYRLHPMTQEELNLLSRIKEWSDNYDEYENNIKSEDTNKFKFLRS